MREANCDEEKIYRLALFGLSGSGKTCTLTALALGRVPNPRGYTCTWVPVVTDKRGERGEYGDGQNRAKALESGKRRLEETKESVTRGDVPGPDVPGSEYPRFVFQFTAPDYPPFRAELIDYSGELLKPEVGNEELASILHQSLTDMDGILVIAEAPKSESDEHKEEVRKRILQVETSFALVKGKMTEERRLNAPVALLINKCDRMPVWMERYDPLDYETFLSPYKRLHDLAKGLVTEFNDFRISALGPCELKTLHTDGQTRTIEAPLSVFPLKSESLEDPFVWAVQRRDAIDLASYEKEVDGLSRWKPGIPFRKAPAISRGRDLIRRFPENSSQQRTAENLLKKCQKIYRVQCALAGVYVLLALLIGEAAFDYYRYSGVKAIVDYKGAEEAKLATMTQSLEWLREHTNSAFYRHLVSKASFLRHSKAEKWAESLDRGLEDLYWLPVITDPNLPLQVKKERAEEYMRKRPNGRHVPEAENITREAELKNQIRANEDALTQVEAQPFDTMGKADLTPLREKLAKLPPYPKVETDEQGARRRALVQRVEQRMATIVSEEDWQSFEKDYHLQMDSQEFSQAAQLLLGRKPETEQLSALKEDFRKRVLPMSESKVDDLLKDGYWSDALSLIDKADSIPLSLMPPKANLRLNGKRTEVKRRQDRALYEEAVNTKDEKNLKKYLEEAPLKTMSKAVEEYLQYLSTLKEPLKLTLVLSRITWGDNSENQDDNIVTVYLNNEKIIEKTPVTSRTKSSTGEIGRHPFTAQLDKNVSVRVRILDPNRIWPDYVQGECEITGHVKSLDGLHHYCPGQEGRWCHVDLNIEGIPQPPVLRPWSE